MKAQGHPKAYDLSFEQRDGYLYACLKSPSITYAMALDYFAEIANQCAEARCRRLLIERDIPAMMPTPDALRAMAEYVRISRGVRTAFVNPHGSVGEALKDVITIGAEKGDVAYFTTVAAAEKWLRQK